MTGSVSRGAQPSELSASLESLFRRYDHWLRTQLRRRYGSALADDLAQETYLRAAPYEAAGRIRHPKALLMRIADNLARDRLRSEVRLVQEDASDLRPAEPVQDRTLLVKQIVLALPQELRNVFVLNQILGLTYEEIAHLRGLPLTTVHHRMRQALKRTSAALRE